MFQKLYRHLEDIKHGLGSLQRNDPSNEAATEIGERAIDQLELINMGLRSMERRSAKTNMVGFAILVVVIIACTGVFAGGIRTRGRDARTVSAAPGAGPGFGDARSDASVPGGLVPDAQGYVGEGSQPKAGVSGEGSQPKTGGSGEEQRLVVAHLGKLDSLIAEQAKTIQELKELNATSVATFRRMRRHFAVTEGAPAKAKVEGDSAVAVQ